MVAKPGERWILARPRGGLNDLLCQIEKCWAFAERTHRQIAFDTRESGLLLDFDEVFDVVDRTSSVIPCTLTSELISTLNGRRAFPGDTEGNVTGYDKVKDEFDEFHTLPSHQDLKFSLKRDYPEEVVVYEGMGGGVASFCALRRLTLRPWLRETITNALESLPHDYTSIHVRHSDLKTDYTTFLDVVARRATDLPVFVSSDSDEVIDYAKDLFGPDRSLNQQNPIARPGSPLHDPSLTRSDTDRRQQTAQMFVELFSLAGGKDLYYTDVNERFGVSGFSRLAGFLALRPDIRAQLLGSPSPNGLTKGETHHVATWRRQLIEGVRWWRDVACRYARSK